VFLGLTIAAFVLMLLGYLVSGWILKGGKVRRPWSTSWWSVFIAALLSFPLLIAYAVISNRGEGGLPFPLVAFLGTVIVGVLIWLWMTWAHRGPAAAAVAPASPLPEALEGSQAPSSSSTAAAVEPPADPPAKN
jgi:signal transduction histidine kinase